MLWWQLVKSIPSVAIISTSNDRRLLERLLRSLAVVDAAMPVQVFAASPRANEVPLDGVLPAWLSGRTALVSLGRGLRVFARPFVLRAQLGRAPASPVLLLDERMVLLRHPERLLSQADAELVLFPTHDSERVRPSDLSVVHSGALLWGAAPPGILEQWCVEEAAMLRRGLRERIGESHWLDGSLRHREVVMAEPNVLWSAPTSSSVLRDRGRSLTLTDLPPEVLIEPWRLAVDFPRTRESVSVLNGLLQAHGHLLEAPQPPAGDSGEAEERHLEGLRQMYSHEVERWLAGLTGEPPSGGSFDDVALKRWLREAPNASSRCSRYALIPWYARPDLQHAFPDPTGTDGIDYLRWCQAQGVLEENLRVEQLTAAARTVDVRAGAISLVGYTGAILGVGESARRTARALAAAGYELRHHPVRTTANQQHEARADGTVGDRAVVVLNPDRLVDWWVHEGVGLLRGCQLIGLWAWEVDMPPPDVPQAASIVSDVWTPSRFSAECLTPALGFEPWVFRHPVAVTRPSAPGESPPLPDLVGVPYLLCVVDYHSVSDRKNPAGAVEAFTAAFGERRGPALVIKTINEAAAPVAAARLRHQCAGRSDIHVIDAYMSDDEMKHLVASALAVVSLHRAEGFGIVLADAMGMGVPVIATGYSGNLDFMNQGNSLLVDYQLVPVGPGCAPYDAKAHWASPVLSQAAEFMQLLHARPNLRTSLGNAAQDTMGREYSLSRCAAAVAQRLNSSKHAAVSRAHERRGMLNLVRRARGTRRAG